MRKSLAMVLSSIFTAKSFPTRSNPARCEIEILESRQLLSTYYVSTAGHDNASGTSSHSAWKSINRVNQQVLKAGDKVLFQGGKSFTGSLYVPSREGGTASRQVIFSTYGSGRATIYSGSQPGIDVAQAAGVAITNLNFIGSGGGSSSGIYIHCDFSNKKLSSVTIRNADIHGYARDGILITDNGSHSSTSNVKIQNVDVYNKGYDGIKAIASSHNANKNWLIDHVNAYNNSGSTRAHEVTGSGIFIADVQYATVQFCTAHDNGKNGAAPVGIWSAGSDHVTFQHNESYNNRTHAISDGGGFDFDWDVTNSVMQYNYSHGNDGPGYLLYAGSHTSVNNVIRYNISENDGRKNGKTGIDVGGNVTNASIDSNTIYIAATGSSTQAAFQAHDWGSSGKVPKNISVRDNIFYTYGKVAAVYLTQNVAKKGSFSFVSNDYYSGSGQLKIQWGNKYYSDIYSWRRSNNQEHLNGIVTGSQKNPRLLNPGKGGTISNPDKLTSLTAYKLQHKSPMVNIGEVHSTGTFLASAEYDFWGDLAFKGGKHDIGADELR